MTETRTITRPADSPVTLTASSRPRRMLKIDGRGPVPVAVWLPYARALPEYATDSGLAAAVEWLASVAEPDGWITDPAAVAEINAQLGCPN